MRLSGRPRRSRFFAAQVTPWPGHTSAPPVHLVDGARTGSYRVKAGNSPITDETGQRRITVADYAAATVGELERGTFIGQRFTAAY